MVETRYVNPERAQPLRVPGAKRLQVMQLLD